MGTTEVQETNDRLRKEQQKSTGLEKRAQKSEQDVDALRNKVRQQDAAIRSLESEKAHLASALEELNAKVSRTSCMHA